MKAMKRDDELRFALVTFERVFDTDPVQEALTLDELSRVLRRFELKPKLQGRIEREEARVDALYDRYKSGEALTGWRAARIRRAAQEADAAGGGRDEAVRRCVEALRSEAGKQSKKELRIWSPALYRPDAPKRGGDHVSHVSCLVLDYDDGSTIEEATEVWDSWYHLVHTTWSHTPARHKFRLILPLARPVPAEDWREVWQWAQEYSGGAIDPACKSPASTFALPAVPSADWPRRAFVHGGGLLDPFFEVRLAPGALAPAVEVSKETSLVAGHPDAVYVSDEAAHQGPESLRRDPIEGAVDDEMWDLWPDSAQSASGAREVAEVAGPVLSASELMILEMAERVEALEARVEALTREVEALGRA